MIALWVGVAALIVSCSPSLPVDRSSGPSAALDAAKAALRNHDAYAFYDSLGEKTALFLFKNTVNVCVLANSSEGLGVGLSPLPDCMSVLYAHGWEKFEGDRYSEDGLEEFARNMGDFRSFAALLDSTMRSEGSGSSFVWDHLEEVELLEIRESNGSAVGTVSWDGENRQVEFVKDASGWRVETLDVNLQNDA